MVTTQVNHFASAQGAPERHVSFSALPHDTRNAFASHALFWRLRRFRVECERALLRLCSAADLSSYENYKMKSAKCKVQNGFFPILQSFFPGFKGAV
jgi:hypothetical protein